MRLVASFALSLLLVVAGPYARAADVATMSCLDLETPPDVRDAIIVMMRDLEANIGAKPELAKIRAGAAAAVDRCRARNQWNDQAAAHARGAFIAKLGMEFTRPRVSEAGFDPAQVIVATRALSDAQRTAMRAQDQQALAAFASALNRAGVFPKTYQQGKVIGAFAAFSILYDESARLFALD